MFFICILSDADFSFGNDSGVALGLVFSWLVDPPLCSGTNGIDGLQ